MNTINVYGGSALSVTLVSNDFIDNHMTGANDAQLKTYLYVLRMMSAGKSFTITDVADTFNQTEREIIRSLKYWEKEKLLVLEGEKDNITGIRLLAPGCEKTEPKNNSNNVALTVVPINNSVKELSNKATVDKTIKDSDRAAEKVIPEKSKLTQEALSEYVSNTDFQDFLAVTEQYLSKELTAKDIQSLIYINKDLGFSLKVMHILLEYCVSSNKKNISYIEKTAIDWYMQGINTPTEAKKYLKTYENKISNIMAALGKNTYPSLKELDFINKWTLTYGFSPEMIKAGCERCVMSTDSHRFEYAEGIFKKWHEAGYTTVKEVEEAEKNFRNRNQVRKFERNDNKFAQILKSDYDISALERDILSN